MCPSQHWLSRTETLWLIEQVHQQISLPQPPDWRLSLGLTHTRASGGIYLPQHQRPQPVVPLSLQRRLRHECSGYASLRVNLDGPITLAGTMALARPTLRAAWWGLLDTL